MLNEVKSNFHRAGEALPSPALPPWEIGRSGQYIISRVMEAGTLALAADREKAIAAASAAELAAAAVYRHLHLGSGSGAIPHRAALLCGDLYFTAAVRAIAETGSELVERELHEGLARHLYGAVCLARLQDGGPAGPAHLVGDFPGGLLSVGCTVPLLLAGRCDHRAQGASCAAHLAAWLWEREQGSDRPVSALRRPECVADGGPAARLWDAVVLVIKNQEDYPGSVSRTTQSQKG